MKGARYRNEKGLTGTLAGMQLGMPRAQKVGVHKGGRDEEESD